MSTEVTGATKDARDALLSIRNLSLTFPGTKALDKVELSVRAGEVHALVGMNGSGKSSLIKVLSGFYAADPGATAQVADEFLDLGHTAAKRSNAMAFVHQDLGLILEMSTLDNFALRAGYERSRIGKLIDWKAQARLAEQILARFEIALDVTRPLSEATPVQRTMVAIAGAMHQLHGVNNLLVLDEPTAVLPQHEVEHLFRMVKDLRDQGTSVLYVSHRLDELFKLADRVTVLRGGHKILTRQIDRISKQELVSAMLGTELIPRRHMVHSEARKGEVPVLEIRSLRTKTIRHLDLNVYPRELLGIAGLGGSGREELPYAVVGALPYRISGSARRPQYSEGWTRVDRPETRDIAFAPADRGTDGVIEMMDVRENMTLSALAHVSRIGTVQSRRERDAVARWESWFGIKMASDRDLITSLSGGNQQKVLLSRCMAMEPRILVLAEPTAGVDIGARQAIYDSLAEAANSGLAMIVASSDIGDLIELCSRVIVMRDGVAVAEFVGDEIDEHTIVRAVQGVERDGSV
jgi:ABC-type sugar transport system ATPase subunit